MIIVMLSSLLVRIPREKLHDVAAGGLIGCAGSAREARRKWAQALADTREAETRQPLSHLMARLQLNYRASHAHSDCVHQIDDSQNVPTQRESTNERRIRPKTKRQRDSQHAHKCVSESGGQSEESRQESPRPGHQEYQTQDSIDLNA